MLYYENLSSKTDLSKWMHRSNAWWVYVFLMAALAFVFIIVSSPCLRMNLLNIQFGITLFISVPSCKCAAGLYFMVKSQTLWRWKTVVFSAKSPKVLVICPGCSVKISSQWSSLQRCQFWGLNKNYQITKKPIHLSLRDPKASALETHP